MEFTKTVMTDLYGTIDDIKNIHGNQFIIFPYCNYDSDFLKNWPKSDSISLDTQTGDNVSVITYLKDPDSFYKICSDLAALFYEKTGQLLIKPSLLIFCKPLSENDGDGYAIEFTTNTKSETIEKEIVTISKNLCEIDSPRKRYLYFNARKLSKKVKLIPTSVLISLFKLFTTGTP